MWGSSLMNSILKSISCCWCSLAVHQSFSVGVNLSFKHNMSQEIEEIRCLTAYQCFRSNMLVLHIAPLATHSYNTISAAAKQWPPLTCDERRNRFSSEQGLSSSLFLLSKSLAFSNICLQTHEEPFKSCALTSPNHIRTAGNLYMQVKLMSFSLDSPHVSCLSSSSFTATWQEDHMVNIFCLRRTPIQTTLLWT